MKRIKNDPTGKDQTDGGPPATDLIDETDLTDEKSRYRVVSASDSSVGAIGFDELGQPRWTWITEIDGSTAEQDDTFNYLKALDNESLAIEDGSGTDEDKATPRSGYNPYDTARSKITGRLRKR